MKKKIFGIAIGCFLFLGITAFAINKYDDESGKASDKGGKWVAVYGGGSTIQSCKCVTNLLSTTCAVGDTSTALALCGGSSNVE